MAVSAGGGGVESLSHFTCYFFRTGSYCCPHHLSFGAHEVFMATWHHWKIDIDKYCLVFSECSALTDCKWKTFFSFEFAPEDSASVSGSRQQFGYKIAIKTNIFN